MTPEQRERHAREEEACHRLVKLALQAELMRTAPDLARRPPRISDDLPFTRVALD